MPFDDWARAIRAEGDRARELFGMDPEELIASQSPDEYAKKAPRESVVRIDGKAVEVAPCECGAAKCRTTHARWCPAWTVTR